MIFIGRMICLFALFFSAQQTAANPTDFGPGTQIGRFQSAGELGNVGRRGYRDFKKQLGYFGAFAMNAKTDDYFWVRNYHSAAIAKAAAIEGCRQISAQSGCELYAVMMPESLSISTPKAEGFSREAADAFNTEYRENREPGKFYAFALSGANQWGYAYGYDTAADARDTAVSFCASAVAQSMAEIGPEGRKWAKARKLDRCKVVNVEQQPSN